MKTDEKSNSDKFATKLKKLCKKYDVEIKDLECSFHPFNENFQTVVYTMKFIIHNINETK